MYAEVLIEYPTKKIDKFFTYKIPQELIGFVKVGMKVKVPFNTSVINGFVMNVSDTFESDYELKTIISVIDREVVLNEELMSLGKKISSDTLCPLISAYQTMFPSSLKIKDKTTDYNSYVTYLALAKEKAEIEDYLIHAKPSKQVELLSALLDKDKVLKKDYSSYVVKALKDKEFIKEEKEQVYRINESEIANVKKYPLNEEQLHAYNVIKSIKESTTILLEGVTGSGKTEVYLNLIQDVINSGKTAIVLVPEISLTTQIVKRFYNWFGNDVAIFHSALSDGEKYDEYLKVIRGETKIVVGTRSAIFTPLKNIGIIIIDEEHSDTYKQENSPRYNAIEVAKFRSEFHKCPLVLGSATPTLESKARALKGVYQHLLLTKRAGDSILPTVEIVDMTEEIKKKKFILSTVLEDKIKEKLAKNEQIVILLNRRGYSTTITCSYCGYTYKCPNCDITLTFHKSSNNLRCHYCGYTLIKEEKCPSCGEEALNYLGLGTEKVENYLKETFKEAKIIRMDQDTTIKKGAHEKIINAFKNREYDILLGTQMISKGLDFPYVTLVGILNADSTLNIPDFRSNERTFSLLYQASGRAGRSNLKGEVIIQTFNPDNYVLKCVQNNDFTSFYDYEMNIRRMLKYPPYYYLVSIRVIASDYNEALNNAQKICAYLKNNLDKTSIILGPTTASMFKLKNKYRFQIVIKYRFDKELMRVLKYIDDIFINNKSTNVEIDVGPLHI